MKISKLKTMTTPNPVDVLLALDIDGGQNYNPTLRLVTVASILALLPPNENPAIQSAINTLTSGLASANTSLNSYIASNNANIAALQTLTTALQLQGGNNQAINDSIAALSASTAQNTAIVTSMQQAVTVNGLGVESLFNIVNGLQATVFAKDTDAGLIFGTNSPRPALVRIGYTAANGTSKSTIRLQTSSN